MLEDTMHYHAQNQRYTELNLQLSPHHTHKQLNAMLEDAGILPKISATKKDDAAAASEGDPGKKNNK